MKAKAQNSKLVRQMRADLYSDGPEQVELFGDERIKGDREDKDRQQYEEEMFLRLSETKKEKGIRKAKQRIKAFDDFDDFGDLALISANSQDKSLPKKSQLVEQSKTKQSNFELDDDDFDEGMAAYSMETQASQKKKQKREAEHPKPVSLLNPIDSNISEPGESRAIGDEIMKNRGLTRYRPKDKKNPRKRYRINYEKAVIKRKSTGVKEFTGQSAGYGGEATGIKSTIVRSRKL